MTGFISAPKHCYSPGFDLEQHLYEPDDVQSQDFQKILDGYRKWNRPFALLVTQREGRYLSLGRPSLYLRMDYEGGKLVWSSARSDLYSYGGQVWDDDLIVVHVHLQNTCFWVGSKTRNVLLPSFLEELQVLLKLESKFPWAAVILAGGSNDTYWFSSPSSPRGSGTDGQVLVTDTVERFTDQVRLTSHALYKAFREYSPECELILVGTG